MLQIDQVKIDVVDMGFHFHKVDLLIVGRWVCSPCAILSHTQSSVLISQDEFIDLRGGDLQAIEEMVNMNIPFACHLALNGLNHNEEGRYYYYNGE